MTTEQLITKLLGYKWSHSTVAYGTKNNPDPRDGVFRTLGLGNYKYKDGCINSLVYEKMQKLKDSIKTPCKVEKFENERRVGGTMSVKVEHYDQFLAELHRLVG